MKVAIVQFHPCPGGVNAWIENLQTGFISLGMECDTIAFMPKGKPVNNDPELKDFSPIRWDRVLDHAKHEETAAVLDGYDFIVLAEPRSWKYDNPAFKVGATPHYLKVLSRVHTRWTTMFHNPYEHAPLMHKLFALPSFIGYAVTYSTDEGPKTAREKQLPIDGWVTLPFIPYQRRASDQDYGDSVIMTARLTSSKGQKAAARAWAADPAFDLALFGECSGMGAHPTEAYMLWEEITRRAAPCMSNKVPEKFKEDPWNIAAGPAVFSYNGAYLRPEDVLGYGNVHLSLTRKAFATGHLEYCSLEALDWGLPVIVPKHSIPIENAPYTYPFIIPVEYTELRKFDPESGDLARAVATAQGISPRPDLAAEYLSYFHDPADYARQVISGSVLA